MIEEPKITWGQLREAMFNLAEERSEWAGLPMMVPEVDLVLESKFPYQYKKEEQAKEAFVNQWVNQTKGIRVCVEKKDGRSRAWVAPHVHNVAGLFYALTVADYAWEVEAEVIAMQKLFEMIGEQKFKRYVLTGAFIESSKRSGITYMFRKLRPTLAISRSRGECNILCGLCLHPIGYYSGTHCGSMVPSDDVIAHLALMRGDEKEYWKRANQHPPHWPECGI